MTSFTTALSMAVLGLGQVPSAKTTDQAQSSTKKKAVAAVPAPTEKEIADANQAAKEPAAKKVETDVKK
jgi:hypothetical protein